MKTQEERFWAKVNKAGPIPASQPELGACWTASSGGAGYGQFAGTEAHRYAFKTFRGPIPKGHYVLHRCDNKRCVNYERHLFTGTQKDNCADMKRKGRSPQGEARPNAKLTESDVLEIRRRSQENRRVLAREFNISHIYLSKVIRGEKWGHV